MNEGLTGWTIPLIIIQQYWSCNNEGLDSQNPHPGQTPERPIRQLADVVSLKLENF